MQKQSEEAQTSWSNKVPEVTMGFWVIKILSTTVGETGADFLAVNAGLGKGTTGVIMAVLLSGFLLLQLHVKRYVPWIYWMNVVLVSIVGTQITDALTDDFNVDLNISTSMFSITLAALFIIWYKKENTISIHTIITPCRERFYWVCILCTFALGTAAGDLVTEAFNVGFQLGVFIFGSLIALTWVAFKLGANAVLSFWVAYILTRPLGASLGDLLSQAKTYGGLGFGALSTSVIFVMVILILVAMAQLKIHRTNTDAQSELYQ